MKVDESDKIDKVSAEDEEKGYRFLFENMLEGYAYCKMIFDVLGRPVDFIYLMVNRQFSELTGLKEVVGRKVSEVIPGFKQSNPELIEAYGRVAATGKPEKIQAYVSPLKIWFSVSVYCPKKEYFVAVFETITEQKEREKQLEDELVFNKLIIDEAPSAILVYNAESGQCVSANGAAAEAVGASKGQLLRQNYLTIKSWKANLLPLAKLAISSGKPQRAEEHIVTTFGKEVYMAVTFATFARRGEKFLLLIFEDISERKRMEGEINKRMADLEKTSRLMVGRELRMTELKKEVQDLNRKLGQNNKK